MLPFLAINISISLLILEIILIAHRYVVTDTVVSLFIKEDVCVGFINPLLD